MSQLNPAHLFPALCVETIDRIRSANPELPFVNSYNRYLAVAARVVRRSLKEDKRLEAERRGDMDLRFAKWKV